jgi:mono/diheme cytochrome c family protein
MRARYIIFGLAALLVISVLAVACGPSAATPTVAPTKPAAAPTAAATKPAASPVATVSTAATATTGAAATKPAASPVATVSTAATATTGALATKPAAASPAAGTADLTAGKAVFDANCNGCHPGGDKGVGPAIKGASVSTVTTVVRSGKGSMPAYTADKISDAQLASLAAYVNQLK